MKKQIISFVAFIMMSAAATTTFAADINGMFSLKGTESKGGEVIFAFEDEGPLVAAGVMLGHTEFDLVNKTYLGVGFRSFELNKQDGLAGAFGFYLSNTESQDGLYDRVGLEITTTLMWEVSDNLYVGAGLSAAPEFLSTDWNTNMFLEYSYLVTGEYLVMDGFSVFGEYESVNFLNEHLHAIDLDSAANIGVRFKF